MTSTQHDLRGIGDRIERMLEEMEASADPRTFEKTCDLLRLVTDLYGAGLDRILELASCELVDAMAADELLSGLLLVHGLHPRSLVSRVEAALAQVRPLLAAHAGDVELVGIDESSGSVRLRLLGSCDGCPSSAITLQMAVERAILHAAPDLQRIDVDQPSQAKPGVPVALGIKPVFEECPAEMAAP